MNRVLVTGGTGFVGRQALAALTGRADEIHSVARQTPDDRDVTWHTTDLLRPGAAAALMQAVKPTHVLHLAWDVTPGRYWNDPSNLEWVRASLELFGAFVRTGGERFVGAGTCSEYEWSSTRLSEHGTPISPRGLYGVSKDSLRRLLERADDLGFAWGRLFYLYGPFERPGRLVSDVITNLIAGQRVTCAQGDLLRDYLHVRDAGAAFARLLESDVEGAFNVASGRAVSIRKIVETIAGTLGCEDLVQYAAAPPRPDEPLEIVADVRRISQTGWTPRIGLEQGIKETVAWWQARVPKVRHH